MIRALRLTIGGPPALLLHILADAAGRLSDLSDRAFWRLRDWMDVR